MSRSPPGSSRKGSLLQASFISCHICHNISVVATHELGLESELPLDRTILYLAIIILTNSS